MPCTTGTPDSIQRRIKAVRRLPRVTTSGLMPTPDLRGNRQPFTLTDGLQGVQLKAGAARQLRVESPVEVRQRGPLIQTRSLEVALDRASAPAVQLALQHGREVAPGLLVQLGPHLLAGIPDHAAEAAPRVT